MKKGKYFGILLIFVALILITNIYALNEKELKLCKDECINNKKESSSLCLQTFDYCKAMADNIANDCKLLVRTEKYACLKKFNEASKICNENKKVCLKNNDNIFSKCIKKCLYFDKNITCENGKYNAGDVFLRECNKCECSFNGRLSCKTTEYCNFNNISISIEKCQASNGLYQKLCAGSIMSTKCTQETYCQCGGKLNLSCSEDYSCLYDFYLNKNRNGQFAQEWVRLAEYKKLGNVGICVKNPEISSCGNGVCEDLCKNYDCSLTETKYNCAADCKI